jgi:hypothetical protein
MIALRFSSRRFLAFACNCESKRDHAIAPVESSHSRQSRFEDVTFWQAIAKGQKAEGRGLLCLLLVHGRFSR